MLHFIGYSDKVKLSKSVLARKEGYMGNNDQLEEDEDLFVTLTLEDDTEVECLVVCIFEAAGRDYIALLPTEGPEHDEGEVFIYRYFETDYEFNIASEAFDQIVEDSEYDEDIEEEK